MFLTSHVKPFVYSWLTSLAFIWGSYLKCTLNCGIWICIIKTVIWTARYSYGTQCRRYWFRIWITWSISSTITSSSCRIWTWTTRTIGWAWTIDRDYYYKWKLFLWELLSDGVNDYIVNNLFIICCDYKLHNYIKKLLFTWNKYRYWNH